MSGYSNFMAGIGSIAWPEKGRMKGMEIEMMMMGERKG